MTAEVNIPGEAVAIVAGQLLSNPEIDVERERALLALQDAAPLIVAEARRQWETEQEERMAAEVRDISNARHIYVQRSVDRFVDRNHGNIGEDEIAKRYQQGVDQWNADHRALLALWGRYNALVEAAELRGGVPVTCPTCHGDAESVDDTSLYRCTDCGEEFDEDELDEDGELQ